MADVIGSGRARTLVDVDGDAVGVTGTALDVNIASGSASIDIGDVDLFLDGGTALVGGNGAATSGTLRVTIASDTTGVLSIDDNGGSITIDGTVTANAGSGTLAVSNAGLTELAAAINSSKVDVNISSGGFDGTVSGTVTANAGTNLNTSALATHAKQDTMITHLSEIEGAVETIEAAVDTQMQVDVVAALPAGSNTIGVVDLGSTDNAVLDAMAVDLAAIEALLTTIDADTAHLATIRTAVQLIDNAISDSEMQVDVVAALPAGTNAIGKVGHDITGMVSEVNDDVDTGVEDLRPAGDALCKRVDMMADPANTGYIWVGDSSVANDGTGGGIRLSAGDFYSVDVNGVNDIHVAATVANQKIMYTYYT